MEHIVQFAISVEDEAIVKRIHENAEKTITNELLQDVKKAIFNVDWRGQTGGFNAWTERKIDSFLEGHKDEIIELAGKYLAERLARTKAAKALLDQ